MPILKLNLGCGQTYKKGYINVDAFDNTVADRVMSALDLEFDDNIFSQIDCTHMLEHLGAAKSIYALAEMYRVLQPRGKVVIETPDIEKSFASFLKCDVSKRKLLMNWIYGLDVLGMSHKYGFPRDLLGQILSEAGFVEVRIRETNSSTLQPSLRATCTKTESQIHQCFSHFRRELIRYKIVELEDQVDAVEKEHLLQDLLATCLSGKQNVGKTQLKRIFEISSLSCPKIGLVLLQTLQCHNLGNGKDIGVFAEVLNKMLLFDIAKLMFHTFLQIPVIPGNQIDTYDSVRALMKKSIGKIVEGNTEVLEQLRKTAETVSLDETPDLFSMTSLEIMSNRQLALGSKAFALGNFEAAYVFYMKAVKTNRDSLLGFWNLARLCAMRKEQPESLKYYQIVESLIPAQHLNEQRRLSKMLKKEIRRYQEGQHDSISEPVLTLY